MKKISIDFSITEKDTSETLSERLKTFAPKLFWDLNEGRYQIIIQKPQRSLAQNRALHLFCRQVANELNGVGVTCKVGSITRDGDIESDWDERLVKEIMWRPVQFKALGKKSTTALQINELDKVAKPIMQALANKYDIGLVFPSQLSKHLNSEEKDL